MCRFQGGGLQLERLPGSEWRRTLFFPFFARSTGSRRVRSRRVVDAPGVYEVVLPEFRAYRSSRVWEKSGWRRAELEFGPRVFARGVEHKWLHEQAWNRKSEAPYLTASTDEGPRPRERIALAARSMSRQQPDLRSGVKRTACFMS